MDENRCQECGVKPGKLHKVGCEVDRCPECGVKPGKLHKVGCEVDRCPDCGRQRISCGHLLPEHPAILWSGEWPGKAECREFGWYCYLELGNDWRRCNPDHPKATEDLNRLYTEAIWDPEKARFVLPSPSIPPEEDEKDVWD